MEQLLNHMTDTVESTEPVAPQDISLMKSKVKALERDLYFYKKMSRDLKQQMKATTDIQ